MKNNTFYFLKPILVFIICEHSTWELASVICDNQQDDLFYSAGLHRNVHLPQITYNKKNSGKILDKKLKVNGPERQKLARKKFTWL